MQYVKASVKSFANALVDAMPWGLRRSVLQHLIQREGEDTVFVELATRIGFSAGCVEGSSGWIEGDIRDTGVLFGYARQKAWAEGVVQYFVDFFQGRGGTYLDIGANIGLTTIPIARNPLVHCLSFEPEPQNFRHLQRNLDRNGPFPNVAAQQVAILDRAGEVEFHLSNSNMGDHRFKPADASPDATHDRGRVIRAQARKLADVASNPVLPLAAKIDVQGAEPSVFAGGQQVLSQADLIVFEFWPHGIRQMSLDVLPMLAFLRTNFAVGAMSEAEGVSAAQLRPIAELIDQLELFYTNSRGRAYCDVIVRRHA
jgi:FkbM family methyltransferase